MNKKQAIPTPNFLAANVVRRKSQSSFAPTTEKALTHDQVSRATVDASRMLPTDVMQLQSTIGNRAVHQLLGQHTTPSQPHSAIVQAKLAVGPARDAYEIEADKIANQVVRSPAATSSSPRTAPPSRWSGRVSPP